MGSIRLTNDIRRIILKRLDEHAFAKREAELKAEEHALAERIYAASYSPKVRAAMEALPKGILPTRDDVWIYVDGRHLAPDLPSERPCADDTERHRFAVLGSDPIGAATLAHYKKVTTLANDRDKARREAAGVLNSISTLTKALEIWPEIESFTRDFGIAGKPVTALAIPIKALNVSLGLPPGTPKKKVA